MKALFLMAPLVFLATFTNSSMAQQATPTAGMPRASRTPWLENHPRISEIEKIMGTEYKRIKTALKQGKITQNQATSLNGNVSEAYQQMSKFFQQNGIHGITEDQENQLKSLLTTASQSIDTALNSSGTTTPQGK